MYYSRKRALADLPAEPTAVWSCVKESCNGWMRKAYSFEETPVCPKCMSAMVLSTKTLPILMDAAGSRKLAKENAETDTDKAARDATAG